MKNLLSTVSQALSTQLARPSHTFVLGLSGGLDSIVLLSLLSALKPDYPQHHFKAVYINHGIHPDAKNWGEHCRQQCHKFDIAFESADVQLPKKSVRGMEADARDARYTALLSLTPDQGSLLLAQHQDDQVETLLLQLKRGAGPKGLAGMPERRTVQGNIQICRPLLTVAREDLHMYASQQGLEWIDDPSNQDTRIERNFLRKEVLPLLTQRWPEFPMTVARSAHLCGEQQSLLEEVARDKLKLLQSEPEKLAIPGLLELDPRWQRQIIRQWFSDLTGLLPPQSLLIELDKLMQAREDANPQIKLDRWCVRRFQQQLYLLEQALLETPQAIRCLLSETVSITLRRDLTLRFSHSDAQREQQQITSSGVEPQIDICYGGYAERFAPPDSSQSKPLKQWFKIWALPPWERSHVAKLVLDGQLAAIVVNHRLIVNARATGDFLIGVSVLNEEGNPLPL